jgi:NAD-dependent dihydropyrimidine dehydrogenase PreA subunit
MLCATICPSGCIHITGEVTPEGRSRPDTFELDLARCLFCGMCEEVCPVAAIVMTSEYELATFDKDEFWLTKERLLANQEYAHKEVFVQPAGEGDETVEPPPGARAAASPAGKPAGTVAGALPPGMAEGKRIIDRVGSRRKGMLP